MNIFFFTKTLNIKSMENQKPKTCKKMCPQCPFSNKSPKGYLGPHSVEDMISFMSYDVDFACHMSLETKKPNTCSGFLQMARRSAKSFRLVSLEKKKQEVEMEKHSMSIWDFVKHHS